MVKLENLTRHLPILIIKYNKSQVFFSKIQNIRILEYIYKFLIKVFMNINIIYHNINNIISGNFFFICHRLNIKQIKK